MTPVDKNSRERETLPLLRRPSDQCGTNLPSLDGGIDLRELVMALWSGRWFIICVTALAAVASVAYSLYLPNIYRSEALLAPTDEVQGGGISGMAGQLGGLASLAGINIGAGGSSDKVAVAVAVMNSRRFISEFIREHQILPELLAAKQWDKSENLILFDPEIYSAETEQWVREVEWPKVAVPSDWEAFKAFREIYDVSRDEKTGFVTVTVEHLSPHVAERWARLIVRQINIAMKQHDVEEAVRSVEYLKNQLHQIPLAEMRSVFYQLIEEQTKTMMLAEVRDEYVFSTIDPPVAPEEKSSPKRVLICIAGTFLGAILAVVLITIRYLSSRMIKAR